MSDMFCNPLGNGIPVVLGNGIPVLLGNWIPAGFSHGPAKRTARVSCRWMNAAIAVSGLVQGPPRVADDAWCMWDIVKDPPLRT